jgi:hypothetical protein
LRFSDQYRWAGALLWIGSLCLVPSPAKAGTVTIFDENFDETTPALGVFSAGIFSAVNNTNVDIVGPGVFPTLCAGPESGACVDLDGSTAGDSSSEGQFQLTTPLDLAPGSYTLSFDLIGSQRGNQTTTTVAFGLPGCSGFTCIYYNPAITLSSADDSSGVISVLVSVSVDTPNVNLSFTSDTPGFQGALLDNVSLAENVVTTEDTVTPEPGTIVLLGSALVGLGGLSRLRVLRKPS